MHSFRVTVILLLFVLADSKPQRGTAESPNIVVLFADDLGYGDLGFTGHPSIRTPNLDKLAAEGVRLTNWYSGAPICTPSRAALMTGRLPLRTGMTDNVTRVLPCDAEHGLPLNETTIAEHLKPAGYATGIVGKWHLGQRPMYLPVNRGFDSYYGIPFSVDMGGLRGCMLHEVGQCPPLPLLANLSVVEQPVTLEELAPRYAKAATEFITQNQDSPFFLYMAFSHVHTSVWPCKPQYVSPMFNGSSVRGPFGDAVQELDWLAGQIMDTLTQLELGEHTLVLFTSDNGPWLIRDLFGGSEGPFTGRNASYTDTGKGSTWEGGIRMPAAAWWPGTIPPGLVTTELASTMDIFTTALLLANVSLPKDRIIDGVNLMPILTGAGPSQHEFLFLYRDTELYAVRYGPYKAHFKTKSGYGKDAPVSYNPPLLFNVDADPSEEFPLDPTQYDAVLSAIQTAVTEHMKTMVPGADQMVGSGPQYGVCCDSTKDCVCN